MNGHGIWAIYRFEMARTFRTLWQSIVSPVLSTSLYFVVFGAARAGAAQDIDGVPYAAYIVPGLIMSSIFTQSIFNASFGIYFPKFIGTIYEMLSAPISSFEIVIAYVGAAATKSVMLGVITLVTAMFLAPVHIDHPIWMAAFLILTAFSFSLFGFIIGIWSQSFEQLQFIPTLIVLPLSFLGGSFYAIQMLPEPWRTLSLFNPTAYLISGFRWSFYGTQEVVPLIWSVAATALFLAVCLGVVGWIFKTGFRLKT